MNDAATSSTASQEEGEGEGEGEGEEGERARCEWDFTLSTVVSPLTRGVSDVIGAIELDPTDRLLATGGIARKIRIYTLQSLTRDHSAACDFYICTPAKLSSLAWRPNSLGRVIASGDYDGVVTEYDLERRVPVSERDEHGGRRVWSVDYSADGTLAASGSDDGAARLWDTRCGAHAGSVSACAPVCSVQFDKGPSQRENYMGLGCANKSAYVFDLRSMSAGPVSILAGHRKTVAYVRFAGGGHVVTSSVDGTHRLWAGEGREVRAYRGHSNARSFVGMAVCRPSGLIGCGSESNEVFVYDLRWGEPIWAREFDGGDDERGFVSSVCWREVSEDECALVAGGSNGVLQIFVGRRRRKINF